MTENTKPTLILVDGHSLAFRAYHALSHTKEGGLKTKTGIPTSVCFGFINSLLNVMTAHNPQYLAVGFDLGLPTFRHEADDTYKADRAETPPDFIIDLKHLQELLTAFNIPIVTQEKYEADDILGTLAIKGKQTGYRVKILTGDQDLFQLIDSEKNITVLRLGRDSFGRSGNGKSTEYSGEEVQEKLGITPEQVVDYKALCGDKSDNIPGVKGIGEKTAIPLLQKYGNLDNIYAHIDEIKGSVKTKLEAGKADAYHSQKMARIVLDVPITIEIEDCKMRGFNEEKLIAKLEELELKTFLKKVKELQKRFGGENLEKESSELQTTSNLSPSNSEDEQLSFFSFEETQAAKNEAPLPIKPRIIQTTEQLNELVKILQNFTDPEMPVAWDTETTDLEPRDAKLVGIGCCWGSGEEDVAYIPTGHKKGQNLDTKTVLKTLQPILESAEYPKVLQNAEFDRLILRCQGVNLAGVVFDTMLASYILNPENNHSLSSLSQKYLGIQATTYDELVGKNKTIADIEIPAVANYCGMDVYTTFMLVEPLKNELKEKGEKLTELLLKVEVPLEPVLAQMEYTGIHIDILYLKELSQYLETELTALEKKAYEDAGEKFNLGSPKQLSTLLFDKLQLDTKKSRKIKTGFSTDAGVLEKLQGDHPLIDSILEYRTLDKLKSTYVDALPKLVRKDTQRVHTDFNQTITTTGRLSSSNPNLQNIPIRTEFSRKIRKAFIPEKGWLMVSADYSQIELRILAELSGEPLLIEAYKNNEDVHTVTAKLLFEKDSITPDERRVGKTINFGVIYGMGSGKFARSIGRTSAEGKEFIKRFQLRYAKVFEYLERVQKQAISQWYVETILGRRRYFKFEEGSSLGSFKGRSWDEIPLEKLQGNSRNDAANLRAASNAPIQGSSADIIKVAMIELHEILKNYQSRLLLQVHDELVLEVHPDEWQELQPLLKTTMETAIQKYRPLSVPLVVDINVGENWMDTK